LYGLFGRTIKIGVFTGSSELGVKTDGKLPEQMAGTEMAEDGEQVIRWRSSGGC